MLNMQSLLYTFALHQSQIQLATQAVTMTPKAIHVFVVLSCLTV